MYRMKKVNYLALIILMFAFMVNSSNAGNDNRENVCSPESLKKIEDIHGNLSFNGPRSPSTIKDLGSEFGRFSLINNDSTDVVFDAYRYKNDMILPVFTMMFWDRDDNENEFVGNYQGGSYYDSGWRRQLPGKLIEIKVSKGQRISFLAQIPWGKMSMYPQKIIGSGPFFISIMDKSGKITYSDPICFFIEN